MQLLTSHIYIFIHISIACLFLSISGFLLKYLLFKKKDLNDFTENGLLGFVLIGSISLGLNFFFPLTILVNNIIFIIFFF